MLLSYDTHTAKKIENKSEEIKVIGIIEQVVDTALCGSWENGV